MVIELGPPLSGSSTKISKFYNHNDSEHKLHKTRIENWLSIGFELEFPWLGAYSHNHYTMFNLQYDGESKSFIYPSSKSSNNHGALSLPLTAQVLLKSTPSILAPNSNKNQPPFA